MTRFAAIDRYGLAVLLSAILLVPASIEFLDRAVSTWSFTLLHHPAALELLTHIVDPVPPAAGLVLALAGIAALAGWRPGPGARAAIAAGAAVLVAIALKDELKFAFGRTWPETWVNNNPSWIGDGVFGFQPFHGGRGWESFPSGHMTIITAPVGVFWSAVPRLRWLWAGLPMLVAIGLIGSDYHFLGDVIAGAYLGTACGLGMRVVTRGARTA